MRPAELHGKAQGLTGDSAEALVSLGFYTCKMGPIKIYCKTIAMSQCREGPVRVAGLH